VLRDSVRVDETRTLELSQLACPERNTVTSHRHAITSFRKI